MQILTFLPAYATQNIKNRRIFHFDESCHRFWHYVSVNSRDRNRKPQDLNGKPQSSLIYLVLLSAIVFLALSVSVCVSVSSLETAHCLVWIKKSAQRGFLSACVFSCVLKSSCKSSLAIREFRSLAPMCVWWYDMITTIINMSAAYFYLPLICFVSLTHHFPRLW